MSEHVRFAPCSKQFLQFSTLLLLTVVPLGQVMAQSNDQAVTLNAINVSATAGSGYSPATSSTALGTDTPILNTPFSVSTISRQMIDDQGSQSLEDALRNVPGVSTSLGEGNRDELYLRGVKTKSDFLVDGMRDDSEYIRPMYNVERVDVLKGPAALRFGRAGAGGVINLVKKKAERRDIRHVELEGGSRGKKKARFDLGSAVGEKGAIRIMGMGDRSHGYRDHTWSHTYAINPEFHYDLNDDTQLSFGISYLDDRGFADRGIPSRAGTDRPDKRFGRKKTIGDRATNRYQQKVMSSHFDLEHRLNDDWVWRNHLRWNHNKRDYFNIYAKDPADAAGNFRLKGYNHPAERSTYQDRLELTGHLTTGKIEHTLLAGVDLTWQRDHDTETRPAGSGGSKTLDTGLYGKGNLYNRLVVHGVPMTYPNRDNVVHGKEYGIFLQDELSFNKHWQLLLGGRFDYFSTRSEWRDHGEKQKRRDKKFSPRAAITFKPTDNQTFYTSFSRTYTPAGANLALGMKSPDGSNIAPQKADSYELGHKLALLNDRLLLTTALFQIDQTNIKDKDPVTGDRLPVGKHRTRGIELTAQGQMTEKWHVAASYAYLESETRQDVTDVPAGHRIALVPHNQFSLWSTYDVTEHWGFGGGIHGVSMRYASVGNEVKLPGYVVGSLMAYYQAEQYRLQLNLDNVGDTHYYSTAQGDNQIMPGAPRSISLNLSMDF